MAAGRRAYQMVKEFLKNFEQFDQEIGQAFSLIEAILADLEARVAALENPE